MSDPTPGVKSYGTGAHVAALVPVYTDGGVFNSSTNPTLATVVGWIDQVSALLNTALAGSGFSIPLTNADSILVAQAWVEQAVADLAANANSAGRFFTDRALERGVSPMQTIRKEVLDFIEQIAGSLEAIGASRTNSSAEMDIAYRESDDDGEKVEPLFQRKAFGERSRKW